MPSIKTIALCICLVWINLFFSCDKSNPTSSNNNNDIEIKGTWKATVDFEGTLVVASYNVSNTKFDVNWGDEILSFEVLRYDNTKNFCILKFTNHPADEWNNKYGKFGWVDEPTSIVTIKVIDGPRNTIEEAENASYLDLTTVLMKQQ